MRNTARQAEKLAKAPTSGHLQVVDRQAPERLLNLMRERDRLAKQVMAKRKIFAETEAKVREIASMIAGRTMPIAKKIEVIDQEIHAIFHALLAKGRLSRGARQAVESVYQGMQEAEVISPDPSLTEDPWLDEMFGEAESNEHASAGRHPIPEEDLASAERPSAGQGGQTLRTVFRKLAMAIHPDKAHGKADHARRAEAMKEVTQAYQNGDLARLLELEAAWLVDGDLPEANDHAEIDRRCEQVALEIQQLSVQLKVIALDLRELRSSPPAKITKGLWRASPRKVEAEIAYLEADGEREVRKITLVRDYAKAFLAGRISLPDFVLGPPELRPKHAEVELTGDMLLDLFVNGIVGLERGEQGRGRRPRGRRP